MKNINTNYLRIVGEEDTYVNSEIIMKNSCGEQWVKFAGEKHFTQTTKKNCRTVWMGQNGKGWVYNV